MIEDFHRLAPYSLPKEEKDRLLREELNGLTKFHREHCPEFAHYLDAIGFPERDAAALEDVPFVPVQIFKYLELKSIPDDQVFKVMMSSGTSGQRQSKVFLNKETAILQQKVLLRLLGDFIGSKRLPMLIIDSPAVVRDRRLFTTRGATIMGLDFAARKMVFALREDMTLDKETLCRFAEEYGGEKFIISASEKLLRVAVLAAKHPGVREIKKNNLLVRVELPELYPDCMEYKGDSGFFLEYHAKDLAEVVPLLGRRCQTVTYVGELEGPLRTLVRTRGVRGVDRIVPMGHSMDLSFVWDGYVLPETLSRYISHT